MPMTFNGKAIWASMAGRIEAAVNTTAREAEGHAVQKAPVRKVFQGSVGNATLQSKVEVRAESHMRRQLGLAPGPVRTQRTQASSVHSTMALRQLNRRGQLKFHTPLTARGRFEVKSGRAAFRGPDGVTLGGRLRGEIHMVAAEGGGPRWTARVVSPTPYAKYVEFGTRHNRAQPYLRPTLEQVRESFRARCIRAVQIGRAA
jgi:HK97 gp10 family phage protein